MRSGGRALETVIVRHTSVRVAPTLYYGQTDVSLRESFAVEATRVRDRLSGEGFDAVYTSPLSRCARLAGFCGYEDAVRDARLLELDFGEWENRLASEIDQEAFEVWMADQIGRRCPGGESIGMLRDRFAGFIEEKREEGHGRILLFAHGGILLCADMLQGLIVRGNVYEYLRPYGSVVAYQF